MLAVMLYLAGADVEYDVDGAVLDDHARPANSVNAGESTPRASTAEHLRTEYTIRARLDPSERRVTAEGSLRFTNSSAKPQRELWFHLYLNAFRTERTVFMRAAASARRSARSLGVPGGLDVLYLRSDELGGTDLWKTASRHSPNDPDDATDIRVPLPHPLQPGATLNMKLAFEAQLPELVERSGFSDEFFLAAQWYPQLAKLEPDGTWVHHSFHPQAEFYADFATYRVVLDVPDTYKLGATGTCTSVFEQNGRRRERYEAINVHDFAWTAWPHFVSEHFSVAGVNVIQLSPPGHRGTRKATRRAVRFGLQYYSQLYGPYPYRSLTVVHPPSRAAPAFGMEYPNFITTGGAWFLPMLGVRSVEQVTLHELGHQWFFGTVASDEYRWPVLDEGLTSFAELQALDTLLGSGSALSWGAFSVSQLAVQRTIAAQAPQEASTKSAVEFRNFAELGALVYARPAIALETLARVYGRTAVSAALRSYATENQYKHATPEELVTAISTHVGASASDALRLILFDGAKVDYSVERLQTYASPDSNAIRSRVLVKRAGELSLPVKIRLVDSDQNSHLRYWEGTEKSKWFDFDGPLPIVLAIVDPERAILLDDNLFNNSKQQAAPTILGLQALLMLVAQSVLLGLSL